MRRRGLDPGPLHCWIKIEEKDRYYLGSLPDIPQNGDVLTIVQYEGNAMGDYRKLEEQRLLIVGRHWEHLEFPTGDMEPANHVILFAEYVRKDKENDGQDRNRRDGNYTKEGSGNS